MSSKSSSSRAASTLRALGTNDAVGNNTGITWNQVFICMSFVALFAILYYIRLSYRRRVIQTILLNQARRAHAASLQYIGDQVVDAETLKDIRTRVVRIIFPPGVTVQGKEEPEKRAASPTIAESTAAPTAATNPQQEDAEAIPETAADDQPNQQEEEGEKPIVSDKTTNANSTADEIQADPVEQQQPMVYYDPESNVVEQDGVFLDGDSSSRFLDDSARSDYVRECSICLGDYKVGDETATSKKCSHVFHRECLLEWSAFKKECPICRTEMWEPEEFERLQKDIAEQIIPTEKDGVIRR